MRSVLRTNARTSGLLTAVSEPASFNIFHDSPELPNLPVIGCVS